MRLRTIVLTRTRTRGCRQFFSLWETDKATSDERVDPNLSGRSHL